MIKKREKKKILRAAIYLRVSTPEKSSKWVSISAQKREIISYIERYSDPANITEIENVYSLNKDENIYIDDWHSWASNDRPALNKLMEDAENNKFDIVFVWKVDRFFRRTIDLLDYVRTLTKKWILFKATSQSFETNTANWKMILGIFWILAELERDLIRERTMLGKKTKSRKWFYVWWWVASLWYTIDKGILWNKLLINKEEAEVVKRIFDLFVNEKKSINEIAKIFTNEKVITKHSKRNYSETAKKKMNVREWIWYPTTISEVLKNTKYIWVYYYWRYSDTVDEDTRKRVKIENPKDEWLTCKCARILKNNNIFNKAQVLIWKNKILKNNKISYTFTWLIECSHCNMAYYWYKGSKWTLNYKCWWSKRDKNPGKELCKNNQKSELILIDAVWKKLNEIFKNPKEILEAYYQKDLEENDIIKKLKKEKNKLDESIEINEKALYNANDDYYSSSDIGKKSLKKLILNYEIKISDLYERLEEVKNRIENFNNIKANSDNLVKLIKNYKIIFAKLTDEDKIEIIKEFVEKIEIDWDDIHVIFKFSVKNNKKWWWNGKIIKDKVVKYTKEVTDGLWKIKNAVIWTTIIKLK